MAGVLKIFRIACTARFRALKARFRTKGFSLIELLCGVLILSFCLTGMAMTFIQSFILTDMARSTTLATNALQAKVEALNGASFANLTTQAGAFNLTDYGYPSTQSKGGVFVQTDFDGYSNDLTRIRVTACFQSRSAVIGNNLNNCTSSPVEAVLLRTK